MHYAVVYISCIESVQVCGTGVSVNKADCKVILKLLHKTFFFPPSTGRFADDFKLFFKQVQLKPLNLWVHKHFS